MLAVLAKWSLRSLIFFHRWIGIALCVVFLLWFPSGIGMMYWGFPEVTPADRLDHSPRLEPGSIVLSPQEAAQSAGVQLNPSQLRLNTFDGRPAYRFGGGRGGAGRGGRIVYADTGETQTEVSAEMLDRIAAQWAGQPVADAKRVSIEETDQWTVAGQLANLRPMYKYSWPDGQQVYLNGVTGEVVQYTTLGQRITAHLSAIPHWIYYTPLRKRQSQWLRFMIWSSLIGTFGAMIGVVVAVWMYSPKRRYRLQGRPTGIPYRGWKRWHWILGMVFGVATVTWTFSGLMTLGPFPIVQRLAQSLQGSSAQPGRGDGAQAIAAALSGRVSMTDFASTHPREILEEIPNLDVRELEWTSFDGAPIFRANLGGGESQHLSLDGVLVNGFDQQQVIDIVRGVVSGPDTVEIEVIDGYDLYYLDRRGRLPLPVIRVRVDDAESSRYYVDPASGAVVGSYSSRNWVNRWLYSALHSLDLPLLYNHRPLWDIVVIAFMVGGTGLCVTSLALAWRTLGRKLRRVAANDLLPRES